MAASVGAAVGSEAQPDRAGFAWCRQLLAAAVAVRVHF